VQTKMMEHDPRQLHSVDSVVQQRSCSCCCPFRIALHWWTLVFGLFAVISIGTGASQAFGDQGKARALSFCGTNNSCPLVCSGCGGGSQACDFEAIASGAQTSAILGWLGGFLTLAVQILGFVGAMKASGGVWLLCKARTACGSEDSLCCYPTQGNWRSYPSASKGTAKCLLWAFVVLALLIPLWPIIPMAMGLGESTDRRMMAFAGTLDRAAKGESTGGPFGGRGTPPTCAASWIENTSRFFGIFAIVAPLASVVISLGFNAYVAFVGWTVIRELDRSDSGIIKAEPGI